MNKFALPVLAAMLAVSSAAQAQSPASLLNKALKPTPLGCAGLNEHYHVPGGTPGQLFDKYVWPIGRCVPNNPPAPRPVYGPQPASR